MPKKYDISLIKNKPSLKGEFTEMLLVSDDDVPVLLNPKTKKRFKRGDKSLSGKIFYGYSHTKGSELPFKTPIFLTEEIFKKYKSRNKRFFRVKQEYALDNCEARINPLTNAKFKVGDEDANGNILYKITTYPDPKDSLFFKEDWLPKREFLRRRVKETIYHAKNRNKGKYRKFFDIDTEYMISILPDPLICPVFGFKIGFSTGSRDTSLSIDRIDPKKGYTIENVRWVSDKANRIKNDASLEEIDLVIRWIEKNEYTR